MERTKKMEWHWGQDLGDLKYGLFGNNHLAYVFIHATNCDNELLHLTGSFYEYFDPH